LKPLKPNRASNGIYNKINFERKSYWIELERKSSCIFKVEDNTKARVQCGTTSFEIVDLPEQEILTIRSDCTARVIDKILIDHHIIETEDQGTLFLSFIGDIGEIPKFVRNQLDSPINNHTHEISSLKNKLII